MIDWQKGYKYVIGLVHLLPLPGTPLYEAGNLEKSLGKALSDVRALRAGGADGCLLQTVDKIYPSGDDTDYARVSAMAVIAHEVRRAAGPDFLVGVQLMWNCITPSLAVCKVCGADFTRCTAMVGVTDSPFGAIQADPMKVQSYRTYIGARDVQMVAEIQGYHFDKDSFDPRAVRERARSARMVGADAVEIMHPDEEINGQIAREIRSMGIPVVLGGGTNAENCARRLRDADMAFVGGCFEKGNWGGPICEDAVRDYVSRVRAM